MRFRRRRIRRIRRNRGFLSYKRLFRKKRRRVSYRTKFNNRAGILR